MLHNAAQMSGYCLLAVITSSTAPPLLPGFEVHKGQGPSDLHVEQRHVQGLLKSRQAMGS
jgi:hypothetical protein